MFHIYSIPVGPAGGSGATVVVGVTLAVGDCITIICVAIAPGDAITVGTCITTYVGVGVSIKELLLYNLYSNSSSTYRHSLLV